MWKATVSIFENFEKDEKFLVIMCICYTPLLIYQDNDLCVLGGYGKAKNFL